LFFDAPNQVFLIRGDVNESGVGLATSRIFDERLSLLHHLYILILHKWAINIKVKKRCYPFKSLLDILRICLELTLAYAVVNKAELSKWIRRCNILTLFYELCLSELHSSIYSWIMIKSVKHYKRVSQQINLVTSFFIYFVL